MSQSYETVRVGGEVVAEYALNPWVIVYSEGGIISTAVLYPHYPAFLEGMHAFVKKYCSYFDYSKDDVRGFELAPGPDGTRVEAAEFGFSEALVAHIVGGGRYEDFVEPDEDA